MKKNKKIGILITFLAYIGLFSYAFITETFTPFEVFTIAGIIIIIRVQLEEFI